MNKELKAKLIKRNQEMHAAFPNLYDQRWVEKAADKGWNDTLNSMTKNLDGFKEMIDKSDYTKNLFAILYYSSFESALNTFFAQCLDDSMTTIELCVDELQKVTAEIKTRLPGEG